MRATNATPSVFSSRRPTIVPFPAAPKAGDQPGTPDDVSTPAISREKAYGLCASILIGDWIVSCFAVFAGLALRDLQRSGWVPRTVDRYDLLAPLVLWGLCGGGLFTWFMVVFKSYEVSNLYNLRIWSRNLIRSVFLWAVAVWAFIGLFQVTTFAPRLGAIYCIGFLAFLVTLWRLLSFVFLIQPSIKEAASSRVIIVGWNDKVAHLRKAIRRDLSQLVEIIGCVPMPGGHFANKPPVELAILGDYSAIPRIVAECKANAIILSDVSCPAREIQDLIGFCNREMIAFKMVPEYFPALNSGLQVQTLSGVPLLGVSELPLDQTLNRMVKRVADIVGSLAGLCLCALVVPPFALLVRLESPGPVFYRQRRMSRNGRTFSIWKIRSMRVDAESGTGPVWCSREDARRLKIGLFMRRYNIDELPQFWNVLKGDMSLVGPRPERPELITRFKDEIPNYNARHEVRAGLTGWAQIHGLRGDTDLRKRIEADLYYLENWNVMIDLYCIAATFFRVKNAH
ncbi:MAG TPA: sugar transferase [Opitutaceae bacterium]|jgi:exopolysaccharide biosynthesis polyprenyl glycosylphosphotransferase